MALSHVPPMAWSSADREGLHADMHCGRQECAPDSIATSFTRRASRAFLAVDLDRCLSDPGRAPEISQETRPIGRLLFVNNLSTGMQRDCSPLILGVATVGDRPIPWPKFGDVIHQMIRYPLVARAVSE